MRPYQKHLLQSLKRHATRYQESAFIIERIGQSLLARLAYLRYPPQKICELGCGQGLDFQQLQICYSGAEIIGIDFSESQLAHTKQKNMLVCAAEALQLPLPTQYFDLVFANLLLPGILDYDALWQEVQRVLKPGGIFLFSTLGPQTLQELKTVFEALGHEQAVNTFPDMHDIGDSLAQAGFKDPAIDAEIFELHYSGIKRFLKELKAMGSIKLWDSYPHILPSKNFWTKVEEQYRALFETQEKLPVTIEAYYAIAFAPEPPAPIDIPIQKIQRRKN